jgi:DNA helicase-2/ATP-dependent DNA helicase PcrA
MTRAKDDLHLMVPQRFYVHQQTHHGDRHVYATRSRFIPDGLTPLFELCAWPQPEPESSGEISGAMPMPVTDIAARVRLRWQQPD